MRVYKVSYGSTGFKSCEARVLLYLYIYTHTGRKSLEKYNKNAHINLVNFFNTRQNNNYKNELKINQ